MTRTYTAVIHYDAESKCYVGIVPALPGTHSCAETLEDLRANLQEAVLLMLEVQADEGEQPVEDVQVSLEPIQITA